MEGGRKLKVNEYLIKMNAFQAELYYYIINKFQPRIPTFRTI